MEEGIIIFLFFIEGCDFFYFTIGGMPHKTKSRVRLLAVPDAVISKGNDYAFLHFMV